MSLPVAPHPVRLCLGSLTAYFFFRPLRLGSSKELRLLRLNFHLLAFSLLCQDFLVGLFSLQEQKRNNDFSNVVARSPKHEKDIIFAPAVGSHQDRQNGNIFDGPLWH